MREELQSMDKKKVWDLVELPKDRKAVECKWVYKTKRDSDGRIERKKPDWLQRASGGRKEPDTAALLPDCLK